MTSMPLAPLLLALRLAYPTPDTAGVFRRIDAAIAEYMAKGHIPGMSVAIARGGKVVHVRGFGYADLENRVPVSEITAFPTASVLKLLTAVAVLQLAERGRLDLDAPIQTGCPTFPAKRWRVTARRLLAHQAGIRPSRGSDVFNREHFATVRDAVARFADDSLRYEPGTAVQYSNEGYVLLACAIEGASGQAYDEYIGRAILEPAGMTHTFADNVYRVMPHISQHVSRRGQLPEHAVGHGSLRPGAGEREVVERFDAG